MPQPRPDRQTPEYKAKKRAYDKEYRAKNASRIKERQKLYYLQKREQISAKAKLWRERNPQTLKERKKTYYEKNKHEISKKAKIYRGENKGKIRKRRKVYTAKNRGKKKIYDKKYREENSDLIKIRKQIYNQSIEGRAGNLYRSAKGRAEKKSRKFDITLDRIKDALIKQKCEKIGLTFNFDLPNKNIRTNPWAPSIDRINDSNDYLDNDIQIVCWAYNQAKAQLSNDEFELLLTSILKPKSNKPLLFFPKSLISDKTERLYKRAQQNAKRKNLEFDLDLNSLIAQMETLRCQKTLLPLNFEPHGDLDRTRYPWSPSLDRIDNTKGYTPDNTRIVCWAYNQAKSQLTLDEFDVLIRASAKAYGLIF